MSSILVVEDDQLLNKIICGWLEKADYEVHGVWSCDEAFEVLEKEQVDMIFLDIQLSNETGYVILQKLKDDAERFGHIVVVMLSNHAEIEKMDHARQLGAVDFVAKTSVSRDKLLTVARERLGMGVERWD